MQPDKIYGAQHLSAAARLEKFFRCVAAAQLSALLLDFDGTLAPFRVDASKARPWAGVALLLDEIQQTGRTRLAIVTGRPAGDAAALLGTKDAIEIWGLHGAERLYADGRLEPHEFVRDEESLLHAVRAAVQEAELGVRLEEKSNAIAVHWRGMPARSIPAVRSRALELLQAFAANSGAKLLQFDGGLELRIGPDKGDAVRMILREIPENAPVAYLGDDVTDEDAFLALRGRGLPVLVRREWRETGAEIWLHPPDQLRAFLADWLRASQP
jgi:trehalose-phosphatase